MLRASLALGLALASAACSDPPAPAKPGPRTTPQPAARPPGPETTPQAQPPPAPSRPFHPLCDAAASYLHALHHQNSGSAVAYGGTALQQWIVAGDAELGRADDAAITAALADGSPAGFHRSKALIEAAIAQWMRGELKKAAEGKERRADAWTAARCAWEVGLRPLAADVAAAEPELADEVDRAFAAGADAFAAGAADAAALDRVVLPARQVVEKTWYRLAHRRLLAAARDGASRRDPAAASRALGIFEALRDRMQDKNTPGIAVVTAMLAGTPDAIDPDKVERELAVALVKRARKYCSDAVDPTAKAPLGSPASLASAAEGLAFTRILLPDMSEKLGADGFDGAAHLHAWQAYTEAVERGDAEEARSHSADLVQWNCAYQRALRIRECTATVDEAARPSP